MNLDDLADLVHPMSGPEADDAPTLRLESDDDVVYVLQAFDADDAVQVVHLEIAGEDAGFLERGALRAALAPGTMGGFGDSARGALPGIMPRPGAPQGEVRMRCPVAGCKVGEVTVPRLNPRMPPRCRVHRTSKLGPIEP